MHEIVTFLKSLLSRKFALALAAFITTNMAKIPPKWQAIANLVVVGIYMLANVAEKKVAPSVVEVPAQVTDPEQALQDAPPAP
jgi:hypothetical protein